METITVIQHNVLTWNNRKHKLYNTYVENYSDIIILNSTGVMDSEIIKMYNYNVYQRNTQGELHAGIVIAVRKRIRHKLMDDFREDVLAVELQTTKGPLFISTTYLPPRRGYLPANDIMKIMRKNSPAYILGDFNA